MSIAGALVYIWTEPFPWQSTIPAWKSVPLIFFMIFTVVGLFIGLAGILNRFLWIRKTYVPSIILATIAAFIEAVMMEYIVFYAAADPISGPIELALKVPFSILMLEVSIFLYSSFLYPIAIREARSNNTPTHLSPLPKFSVAPLPNDPQETQVIWLKIADQLIDPTQIINIEAENVYVRIHTKTQDHFLRAKFSEVIQQLPNTLGMQCHRSHWVAYSNIADFKSANGQHRIILKNNREVPVAGSRVEHAKEMLRTTTS